MQGVAAYAGDGSGLSPDLQEFRRKVHLTIKKVTDDIEDSFHFNTAIAAVMELVNAFYLAAENLPSETPSPREVFREAVEDILLLLNPMVPHLAEELWQALGHDQSLQLCCWPQAHAAALEAAAFTLVIQVNGKVQRPGPGARLRPRMRKSKTWQWQDAEHCTKMAARPNSQKMSPGPKSQTDQHRHLKDPL